MNHLISSTLLVTLISFCSFVKAQNPVINDQFTADPAARIFNGIVYLFPSHDIPAPEAFPRKDWFCMADYHVFSSRDLVSWTDHGVILTQDSVDWVNSSSFSMWAPDCIERNGKYYFYFPANVKTGKGFGIGVAVAEKPEGPFIPLPEPVANVHGIDPCVFVDKDGQAYIYYSLNKIFGAKLNENMTELSSEPVVIGDFPEKGLVEGPFFFERDGIYYMTYPHVENKIERLEYATSDNPLGPFRVQGILMDETPMGTWTNQNSVIEYEGQWYLFYHQSPYSPKFDKNRSVCIDSMFFDPDGSIRKVVPTRRGVGVTSALQKVQVDRYSESSESGVTLEFIDPANTFNGWKVVLSEQNSWVSYNKVNFGNKKLRTIEIKARSKESGTLSIRLDKPDGTELAEVYIPSGEEHSLHKARLLHFRKGIHDIFINLKSNTPVEADWITFR